MGHFSVLIRHAQSQASHQDANGGGTAGAAFAGSRSKTLPGFCSCRAEGTSPQLLPGVPSPGLTHSSPSRGERRLCRHLETEQRGREGTVPSLPWSLHMTQSSAAALLAQELLLFMDSPAATPHRTHEYKSIYVMVFVKPKMKEAFFTHTGKLVLP